MGDEEDDEEFVELDLEKTLTWTGNAVSIQAGGEFRLPLIVPHPSVLAIQFEVEGGYDIEFSLTFQDDHEDGSSTVRFRECNSLPFIHNLALLLTLMPLFSHTTARRAGARGRPRGAARHRHDGRVRAALVE